MQCPQCHSDNKPGRKFCGACGHPVPSACAHCGFTNDPEDQFCGGCGSPLVAQPQPAVPSLKFQVPSHQSPTSNPQPPSSYTPPHLAERIRAASLADGERKTITALFADLKGSTTLIEGLDPEEARAIIDPALQLMMDAVHRYEDYVAQALGDGIFALFGAPLRGAGNTLSPYDCPFVLSNSIRGPVLSTITAKERFCSEPQLW